jgi:hypothetical protein
MNFLADSQTCRSGVDAEESADILNYVLANTTADNLRDLISHAVATLLPPQLDVLLTGLQTAGVVTREARRAARDRTERCCVRCRAMYTENRNGLQACVMPHQPGKVKWKNWRLMKVYPCCGVRDDVGEGCTRARHVPESA